MEILKNIFFKIVNSYLIAKLNSIIDFCLCKYKIITIIFTIIIWSNRYIIDSYTIYYIVSN